MTDRKTFFSTFLKDPLVAAVRPSSKYLAARIMSILKDAHVHTVVEFGPGEGAVTIPLLEALPEDAQYTVIERNATFAEKMRAIDDQRLIVTEADVTSDETTAAIADGSVDAVIASIPFALLSGTERETVLDSAARLLRPGGICVVFHQYTPAMRKPMQRVFGNVRTTAELFNTFPCLIFVSQKPEVQEGAVQ